LPGNSLCKNPAREGVVANVNIGQIKLQSQPVSGEKEAVWQVIAIDPLPASR